jgi:ParB family chromosome partitioning protein
MSKGVRASQIKMIPIDRINILNPRVRSQKVFEEIAGNIAQIGLKRPITVTACSSSVSGKDYDLVCGQGRLEAYLACGQKEIPALTIEANEEQALIMSLVENLARRQHRAMDLLQGIELLQKQGYDLKTIAAKTGLSQEYAGGVINLMQRGEERLLMAVESGQIPLSVAIKVAEAPDDEQRALQEAYESKQLRGKRLLTAKRLIETRKRRGKSLQGGHSGPRSRTGGAISAQDVLKVYQREVDRKRLLTRKAEVVGSRMLFITEALGRLLKEENFNNLLRAEGLVTLPKPLAELMSAKGISVHG